MLVDNDTFLKELASLFESTKGSVWITHKRLTHDGEDTTMHADASNDTTEYPCLVRVTDGDKVKFSTTIAPGALEAFHATYGTLLKSSFTTLRKRDKKREKQRLEQAAKRKKKILEDVVVEGPKRGAGRRIRQRKEKALRKVEEKRRGWEERERMSKGEGV
ncbi:signal recognition particle 14kD protein-domain-containing protein [Cyathus striatus]|nr:signal recognition particle 14kD protein-domain-containing protein [Cyathus striatus]